MSVETPITTQADAIRAYRDNKLYDMRGGNVAQCESFIDACRFLLQNPVTRSAGQGEEVEFRPDIVERFLDKAVEWYNSNYHRLTKCYPRVRYAEADW